MLSLLDWLAENWFSLLQTTGIVGALAFNGYSMRRQAEVLKAEFLTLHTQNHREIWQLALSDKSLHRVLQPQVDVRDNPPTVEETIFTNFVILQVDSTIHAKRRGAMDLPSGMTRDIGEFFSLPIPKAVWRQLRRLRSPELVEFVESAVANVQND